MERKSYEINPEKRAYYSSLIAKGKNDITLRQLTLNFHYIRLNCNSTINYFKINKNISY